MAAQTKVGCVAKGTSVAKHVTQASQRTTSRGKGMDTTILSTHRAVPSLTVAVRGAITTLDEEVVIVTAFCASLWTDTATTGISDVNLPTHGFVDGIGVRFLWVRHRSGKGFLNELIEATVFWSYGRSMQEMSWAAVVTEKDKKDGSEIALISQRTSTGGLTVGSTRVTTRNDLSKTRSIGRSVPTRGLLSTVNLVSLTTRSAVILSKA